MSVLPGRLGLDGAELLHKARHPFLALRMGRLEVLEGCLRFVTEGGMHVIPYQRLSCIILEPGTSVTHDALRLLARHGVALSTRRRQSRSLDFSTRIADVPSCLMWPTSTGPR